MYFSFVILHYNVIAETLKCVDSIKERCDADCYSVVIVDNCSPNGSGRELFKMFEDDPCVTVILNEKNLGFANGNNVGIRYAREVKNADFVIVLNNDTYLIQDDFCETIINEWNRSKFAVMGPKIHTFNGFNQNPVRSITADLSKVRYWQRYHFCSLLRSYIGIDAFWSEIKSKIKKMWGSKRRKIEKKEADCRQENVKLHGCCYVFSPEFFNFFDGFDDRTFMYGEEDILYIHVVKKNLLMVYNPRLEIFHAEKIATTSATKSQRKKRVFVHKECLKSLRIIKKVIQEYANDQ